MIRVICAASVRVARGRASHNPPVVGSSPTRPTCSFKNRARLSHDCRLSGCKPHACKPMAEDRYIAIDPVTCALIQETLDEVTAALAEVGVIIPASAYLFSSRSEQSR